MPEHNRKAGVLWSGDLRTGSGLISTESRALYEQPFNYSMRFADETGTNPEELIAAAHAACFSMALAGVLKKNGYDAIRTDTSATCTLTQGEDGYRITHMRLHVRADVPGLDEAQFQQLILETDQRCPVSNLLKQGLQLEITATLNERIQSEEAS